MGGSSLFVLGKLSTQVAKLIAGPGIYICDECVIVCGEILANELPDWPKHLRCPKDPLKATYDNRVPRGFAPSEN